MDHMNNPNVMANPNPMANANPNPMANANPNPGMVNPMPAEPPVYMEPVMQCDPCETTVTCPEMVDPPLHFQTYNRQNVIVPHIHPSHTTHLQHTHYILQHYFPHTESVQCTTSCEEVLCTPLPPYPCPCPMPFMK